MNLPTFSVTEDLRKQRPYPDGFHNLLTPVALVGSGLILGKDRSLIAAFEVSGTDIANISEAQRNHNADRFNAALVQHFTGGYVTTHEVIRRPSSDYPAPHRSHFKDRISRRIDQERRESFEREGRHFESINILSVRYKPQILENPWFKEIFYTGKDVEAATSLDNDIRHFERILRSFEDSLTGIVKLHRMAGYTVETPSGLVIERDEFINYLHSAYTGLTHPVNIYPRQRHNLETVIGGQEFFPGDICRVGMNYIATVSILSYPQESYPNILDNLSHLPLAYRMVNRMVWLDQHETIKAVKSVSSVWEQQIKDPLAQIFKTKGKRDNLDALNQVHDSQQVLAEAHSGKISFGYLSQTLVLYHSDFEQIKMQARFVVQELNRLGFAATQDTLNTPEAWLGTLPGEVHRNERRMLTDSLHLTHMAPLTNIWTGAEYSPNPFLPAGSPPLMHLSTSGTTPFRFNLHVSDVGHTLLLGPTGAGKSVALSCLAAQFLRYEGATICVFDKGRSMQTLVEACGGNHYDIAGDDSALCFAPLSLIDTDADQAWAEEWVSVLYETRTGKAPTPVQHSEIHRAMTLLRENKAPNERSLTDLLLTLQKRGADDDLKSALERYTLNGTYGELVDAREDNLGSSHFAVFEIEELMAMKEQIAIPVLLYLFRRFERSLKGQPALLILDEAWVMLGHPVFREKIRQWLKELRKKNCAVVLATQSLSDAVQSKIYDVLLESCPTKILLPNEEADKVGTSEHPGPHDLYTMMGLNEREIELIQHGRKKRDYYIISPEGRRMAELGLGPIALAFLAVSDKKSLKRVKELQQLHGLEWPEKWIRERTAGHEAMVG
jgi:type IV secretion system protein TrbE